MRSNLWILAASSIAILSGCSSTPTTDDLGEAKVGSTGAALAKPPIEANPAVISAGLARAAGKGQRLATGQFVTPTAVRGAVQQVLNPGLAAYPNFIAGEAVRSQLSPDG